MNAAALCQANRRETGMDVQAITGLHGAAYRLAARVLGGARQAEDVVQDAYLAALGQLKAGPPPGNARAWFLKIVSNTALMHMRTAARRRRREVAVDREPETGRDGEGWNAELVAVLRRAMNELDAKYRLPVALCCEEGLSQQEAAEVLDLSQRSVSEHLKVGFERLRASLTRAGYTAAPAAILDGLSHTAPPVPTTLAAAVEKILAGKAAGAGSATVRDAVKGGLGMKVAIGVVAAGALAAMTWLSVSSDRFSVPPTGDNGQPAMVAAMPAGSNPVASPVDREETFQFAENPKITRQGDPSTSSGQVKYVITFASKGKCDATVAIVDGQGRIVRHLASGVLGDNAPWPFKQGSLAQSVEWDGRDDAGKPAPAGCKVKVGLGLKAGYGLTMAFSPNALYPFGVACDGQGNAYVMLSDQLAGDHSIRVFSRDGKYVRTLLPQRGGLEAREYAAAFDVFGPAEEPFLIDKPDRIGGLVRGMGLTVSPGGVLAFSGAGYRVNKFLYTIRTDGTGFARGTRLGPTQKVTGRSFLAFSKDERQVYVSGNDTSMMTGKGDPHHHCVFRYGLNDPTPKEWGRWDWGGFVPAFAGERDKPGDDNAHFNDPRGVATDKDGNVYVCDFANSRVQILSPDAKFLRSIKVDRPDQIAVHRKTGNVYVLNTDLLTWQTKKTPTSSRITKFSPEGQKLAVFEFPGCCTGNMGWTTHFALDDSAEPAMLWIGNAEELWSSGKGLWRVADKGAVFENLGDVAAYESWNLWEDTTSEYIAVDREDRWLYCKNRRLGGGISNLARFDAATGKRDEQWKVSKGKLPNEIDEQVVGPDGLLYLRGCVPSRTGDPEYVWRVKPETGEEVPFPGVEGGRIQYPGWHSGKFHRDGFGVAPNGDVHVIWNISMDVAPELQKVKLDAWRPSQLRVHHYGADGKLKREDILPGTPWAPCGVRVDRAGNIYLAHLVLPADKPCPELLWGLPEAMASYKRQVVTTMIGTLGRFGPAGGKFEYSKDGAWIGGSMTRGRVKITGLQVGYVGLGKFGKGCVCRTCRFDLDGFDRAYAPISDLACVMVLDANFNRVARIGSYGNADNQGPQSAFPKPEIGLFRPSYLTVNDKSLYIADRGNLRVLKTTLDYHAEETVPIKMK